MRFNYSVSNGYYSGYRYDLFLYDSHAVLLTTFMGEEECSFAIEYSTYEKEFFMYDMDYKARIYFLKIYKNKIFM